jgi:four helix bundle protein
MDYGAWERDVPTSLSSDVLWRVQAYRLALFAADLGWTDATALLRDGRTRSLSDQLYRALGSISANIAEGYCRSSAKDRCRFYDYALGSAREARDWYYKGRHVLGDESAEERMDLLTQIIRLLLTMLAQQRASALSEDPAPYDATP